MVEFLEHFYDLTVRVSTALQVTAHTFFHEIGEVHALIQSWMESSDDLQYDPTNNLEDPIIQYDPTNESLSMEKTQISYAEISGLNW
jgi:hypothetical protein